MFLFTSVNVPPVVGQGESHKENLKTEESGGCMASRVSSKQVDSSFSSNYNYKIGHTKNQIGFNLGESDTSQSISGCSSGGGSSAKHLHRIADTSINLHLGPQNLAPNENQNSKRSHSPVVRKSGNIRLGEKIAHDQAVEFDNPFHSSVLLLTLDWPGAVSDLTQDIVLEPISTDGKGGFRMESGVVSGSNLTSITAHELDSVARGDYGAFAESLAQYDQLLIVDEVHHKLAFVNWKPGIGHWRLVFTNSGSGTITYNLSAFQISTRNPGNECDVCLTVLGIVPSLFLEFLCLAAPYALPVIICVVAIKLSIIFPPAAPALVWLCINSVPFVTTWSDILGTIVCYLTGPLRDEWVSLFTSSMCTFVGTCSDTYPPYVYLHSPTGGEYYSGTFNIIATVGGEASGIDYVEFDYSTDGGATWADVVGPGHSDGRVFFEGEGSILFDTQAADIVYSNTMKVRVRAADTEGNLSGWHASDNVFTVDNSTNPPTSISVTQNLSPNPCNSYQSVTVYGNAQYNTGSPVTNATATIEILQTGATWTTPLDGSGNYNRGITAPSSPANYTVEVTVDDGVLDGSTSRTLNVQTGDDGDNYDFVRSTTCRNVQSSSPYDPIDETEFFRSDDAAAYVWLHFSDVYQNDDPPPFVNVKWNFYQPDGGLYWTYTFQIPNPGAGYYWLWYKCNAGIYISGHNAADLEGRWSCKVYVDEGDGYNYLATEGFTIRYEFDEHLMAQDVQDEYPYEPINPTNSFCHNDEKALTWARINNVCEDLEIKWEFYEPNGSLYLSFPYSIPDPGVGTPDVWWKLWGWIDVFGYAAESKTGNWHVNVYIQDPLSNWDLEYTDYFEIKECPNVNPSVLVSAVPSNPYEGDAISLSVSATDNGYLKTVSLYWNDGTWRSQTWSNLKVNGFNTSLVIGSYPVPILIRYYATAEDANANQGISEQKVVMVQDIDVEGPQITSGLVAEDGGNSNGRIEDCEQVRISFLAGDPNGVDSVAVIIDSTNLIVQDGYYAVGGPFDAGSHIVSVLAIDGDEPPAANIWVDTFFVDPIPEAPQEIITPQDGDTVDAASVVFTWGSIATADSGYEIQVDTTQIFNNSIFFVDTLWSRIDTSLEVQLVPYQNYYWRLASRSYCGKSGYSENWHFSTSWTGVAEADQELISTEKFVLFQNHPNPFNPETYISYNLLHDCMVKLTIYNMLGHKVKVLVDGQLMAGFKTVHWDGRDQEGNEVSSGIYFYRIQAGEYSEVRKMTLIK
jgi:hypothetical protein